jgi:aspartate aminotransferase
LRKKRKIKKRRKGGGGGAGERTIYPVLWLWLNSFFFFPEIKKKKKAEEIIFKANLDHEYAPIGGVPSFGKLTAELVLGSDSAAIKEQRVTSVQAISGTGALRIAAAFMSKFFPFPGGVKECHMPTPTWGNHLPIFRDSGIEPKQYKYV